MLFTGAVNFVLGQVNKRIFGSHPKWKSESQLFEK